MKPTQKCPKSFLRLRAIPFEILSGGGALEIKNKDVWGASVKKIKCWMGAENMLIKIHDLPIFHAAGASGIFSSPPPLRISNGIALTWHLLISLVWHYKDSIRYPTIPHCSFLIWSICLFSLTKNCQGNLSNDISLPCIGITYLWISFLEGPWTVKPWALKLKPVFHWFYLIK